MRAHDNHIFGYSVDGRERRIVLHTENTCVPEPYPKLDIVFAGVEFYQFRWAALVSILTDITEMPLRPALEALADEIDAGFHRCGWPDRWDNRPTHREARFRELEAHGARFFEIGADFFEGWVVATGFDYVG